MTVIYRRISPVLFFLIPFTALWSGLSMWGIYGKQFIKGEFDLGQSLFGIPFLIGTIVLLSIIAFHLFGRWQITLRYGEGSVFVGVGQLGWTRHFTYNKETLVSMRMTGVRVNEVPQRGILVRTNEKDFIFGSILKKEAKQFVAASIMKSAAEI